MAGRIPGPKAARDDHVRVKKGLRLLFAGGGLAIVQFREQFPAKNKRIILCLFLNVTSLKRRGMKNLRFGAAAFLSLETIPA